MILLITGATHTGKTLLAQKLLEKCAFPYLSIDHLKMGLIRSGNTTLTPGDDEALTAYLWPIVREMIKTAVENRQNLIVEGCYVPFHWRQDFDEHDLSSIRFICLAMTGPYIESHFNEIAANESDIETRFIGTGITVAGLQKENQQMIQGFRSAGETVTLIDDDYESAIAQILESEQ